MKTSNSHLLGVRENKVVKPCLTETAVPWKLYPNQRKMLRTTAEWTDAVGSCQKQPPGSRQGGRSWNTGVLAMTVTSGIGKAYFRDPRGCLNSPGASSFLSPCHRRVSSFLKWKLGGEKGETRCLVATTAGAPADPAVAAQGVLQRLRRSTSIPVETTAHSLTSPPPSQISLPLTLKDFQVP